MWAASSVRNRLEVVDDIGAGHGQVGGRGDQQPGVVVEGVEDVDVGAVGELPVGGIGLPAFVGLVGLRPDVGALGPLARLGMTNPRRTRIRQIVDAAGRVSSSRPRCQAMVCAPASSPWSLCCLRSPTTRTLNPGCHGRCAMAVETAAAAQPRPRCRSGPAACRPTGARRRSRERPQSRCGHRAGPRSRPAWQATC